MTTLLLHINSSLDRRVDDTPSEWITYLDKSIITRSGNIKIHLENIEFPNVLYTFSQNDNLFWYIHNVGGTNELRFLELETDRLYSNGVDVAAALNADAVSKNYGISFHYNDTRARISITNTSNFPIRLVSPYYYSDMTTGTETIYSSCAERIGIIEDMRNTVLAPMGTYMCPGIVMLLPSNCYYLTCNILSHPNGQQSIIPYPYYSGDAVLGRITASNFGSLSQLNYSNEVRLSIGTKTIEALKFTILDDKYQKIPSLNGGYLTFTLTITIE